MSQLKKELISEFFGTFVLILFGTGVVAMKVAFGGTRGGFENITWAWGLAVTFGIYAGMYSGAHLNPAVTIAMAVTKRMPTSKVMPYIGAQTVGAFAAAVIVYINYYIPIHKVDPELVNSAGIFATFPEVTTSWFPGFFDQVLGTGILLFLILASGDCLAKAKATYLGPLVVGLIVVAIGMSFGGMHGYAINPARDFGPRLMTVLAGFKNNGLTSGDVIFWVPIIAPIIGGVLGAILYDKTMGKIYNEEAHPCVASELIDEDGK